MVFTANLAAAVQPQRTLDRWRPWRDRAAVRHQLVGVAGLLGSPCSGLPHKAALPPEQAEGLEPDQGAADGALGAARPLSDGCLARIQVPVVADERQERPAGQVLLAADLLGLEGIAQLAEP
jgi:hypothetical protein